MTGRPDAPIRICVDPNWMPFEKIDEEGNHIGISADFMRYFSKALDIEFQLVETRSWQQSLDLTRDGRCQLLPFINKTEERGSYLNFSDVYFESPVVLVTHEDRKIKGGFQGLNGKTLAVVKGYSYESFLAKNYPDITVVHVESMDQALTLVSEQKADATTAALYMFPFQVQQLRISDLHVASATELANEIRVGVNKDSSYLLPLFNRAIAEIPQQLKNETILKWTPKKPHADDHFTTPLYFLLIIVAIILALWLTWKANKQLRIHNRKLKKMASTDALTGVANRSRISLMIEREIDNVRQTEGHFSVIMLDIDHFKKINDNFGHDAGDKALCFVTNQVAASLRSTDIMGRWGGEEFVILAPATHLDQAVILANKLRNAVKAQQLDHLGVITASFGVTEYHPGDSEDTLMKRVDKALYDAKAAGRDRVKAFCKKV
ncbi:diguanylate cyclase [Oceanospirillum sanctuarii]|uniref:diguanylate cyclase n=1 Tax=Oceanospirillum sanctuarii TaxID=1434821 RepID=UPI001592C572|nr:diguanylate cyclase [Oceanospirillum sanctuarii]